MISVGWEIICMIFIAMSGYFAFVGNMVMAEYDMLFAILCVLLSIGAKLDKR